MSRFPTSDQNGPVLYLGDHALYAAHVIVLGYVVTLLLTTACLALGIEAPFIWLPFDSSPVLRGEVWRVFSYGLVNPPSIPFVIDMFMIGWFGRELEKHFGRRIFLRFYAGLYLLTPLLFTLLGLLGWPMGVSGQTGAFGLFIAFATLYPSVAFFFNIQARWLAAILVGIYTLMHLAGRDLPGLVSLWVGVAYAFGMVRYEQGRINLPDVFAAFRRPKSGNRPVRAPRSPPPPPGAGAEIDALLDKIARHGLHSLTDEERARLDRSSAELMRRKGTGRGAAPPH